MEGVREVDKKAQKNVERSIAFDIRVKIIAGNTEKVGGRLLVTKRRESRTIMVRYKTRGRRGDRNLET